MRAVEHSTIGSIGTVIAQAIEGAGGDYVALFTEVGLDLNTLRDPSVRISSDKMYRLLQLAEARWELEHAGDCRATGWSVALWAGHRPVDSADGENRAAIAGRVSAVRQQLSSLLLALSFLRLS